LRLAEERHDPKGQGRVPAREELSCFPCIN
jgi:hypothetical protein